MPWCCSDGERVMEGVWLQHSAQTMAHALPGSEAELAGLRNFNHTRAAGTPGRRDHQHTASERAWRFFAPSALGRAPDEEGRRAGGVPQPPQR